MEMMRPFGIDFSLEAASRKNRRPNIYHCILVYNFRI